MEEKKWEEALEYIKKTEVLEPDYEKGKVCEAKADIYFSFKTHQWETVQEMYDRALKKYEEEINFLKKQNQQYKQELDRIMSVPNK